MDLVARDRMWEFYLKADLAFLRSLSAKLTTPVDKLNLQASLHEIESFMAGNSEKVDAQFYRQAMQRAVNSLGDDHTQIQFAQGIPFEPRFGGFVADAVFANGRAIPTVVFSTDRRLKVGD